MKRIIIFLLLSSVCFGDTYTTHQKPVTDSTLDIGTSTFLWRYIYSDSFTDGTALWDASNLSGFTSIEGIILTDGTFIATGGIITAGTWQGTPIDISDYTNLTVTAPIVLTNDTIGFEAPLTVPYGGTGAISLTDGGILLGSGTGAITALSVLADGEFIVGDGTTDPVAESGNTARTSLSLGTGDSPTFAGGTFTSVVIGIIPTAGDHFATKEYVDLAQGTFKSFFISDIASGIGALDLAYVHETSNAQSTIVTSAMGIGDAQLVRGFITEAGEPSTTTIHEGIITFHFHAKKGASNHRTTILYAELWYVEANGTSGKTLIATTEDSIELTDTEVTFEIHIALANDVDIASTARLILDVKADVGSGAIDSVVTLYMEGTEDSYFSTEVTGGIWQIHSDVLDDLNTLGAVGADSEFLVGTGAGALAWENASTARTSIGLGNVENTQLSTWAGTTNITTLGTIATVGNITIADGGTIGQSAGPLLRFDDTNNFLEITGCKVGIGTISPGVELEVIGSINIGNFSNNNVGNLQIKGDGANNGITVWDEGTAVTFRMWINDADNLGHITKGSVATNGITIDASGKVGIGLVSPKTKLTVEGTLTLKEQASADGDTAAYGQDWVKNTDPCTKWFTDDTGVDYQLSGIATEVLNGSVTWNPPNLAAGVATTIDVTVNGAALGDFVLVSFSLNIGFLRLTAHISTTNTVRAILYNSSISDVDLGEGTLSVRVLKK